MTSTNYRKIYEDTYGPIPVDETGRTFEIHHIDGNRSNNSIENLQLVSILEHYNIHYDQEDWGACQAISMRMNKSAEDISNECRVIVNRRIAAGQMPWLSSEWARERELSKVKNGTHAWQGEKGSKLATARNLRRVEEGTNPFAGNNGSVRSKATVAKQLANGTHPFIGAQGSTLSKRTNAKLLAEGKHSSQNEQLNSKKREQQLEKSKNGVNNFQLQVKQGTHPASVSWVCKFCNVAGVGLSNLARYHGDNCLSNPVNDSDDRRRQIKKLQLCPHCGKEFGPGNYKKYHGENCKMKGVSK